ncbi:MAG: glycosyltransferase family 39 protein, partial [Spirochaetota bacterium]|nr:glycosyltransferase family 39 protein [Spirochaetota bacterium]
MKIVGEVLAKRNNKILLLILFVTLLLRVPALYTTIIEIDESQYGEFANKVVNGGEPFVSSVDTKAPLSWYYYIWIFKAFGKNNYFAIHVITILWVMVTIIFIYLIGKKRFGVDVGLSAALVFSIFSTTHEPKIIATNGETMMALPLVIGIYFFTLYELKNRKLIFLMLAGIFSGLGAVFRHQAGIQIAIIGIYFVIRYIFLDHTMNSVKIFIKRLLSAGLLTISFMIPLIFTVFFMLDEKIRFFEAFYYMFEGVDKAWNHLLGDKVFKEFIFWNFTFPFKYIASGSQTIPIKFAFIRISVFILFTFPAWYYLYKSVKTYIPALIDKARKRNLDSTSSSYLFLLIWFVFSFIPVSMGGRFYSHYFIQLFPALFLLAGLGVKKIFNNYEDLNLKDIFSQYKKIFIVFILYSVLFFIPRIHQDTTIYAIRKISGSEGKQGVYPEQKFVGEYIKKRTMLSDKILVWGFATPIYTYANRECGSRFSWTDFLVGRVPGPGRDRELLYSTNYILKKSWDQFFEDINKFYPVYFVDTSTGDYHEYGKFPISNYPKLQTF